VFLTLCGSCWRPQKKEKVTGHHTKGVPLLSVGTGAIKGSILRLGKGVIFTGGGGGEGCLGAIGYGEL